MKKVLLVGGTGKLGSRIARELKNKDYEVTAVVRNKEKAAALGQAVTGTLIADVTDPTSIKGICDGFEIVISSLGKSVSLNDKSKHRFTDIDLNANSSILDEARKAGVKKFVYISALGAENCAHLTYFDTHHKFSEKLKRSGIDYTIIKPPAIMSSFTDLIEMAQKGHLMNIDGGTKKTNPIYEGDLAEICVNAIERSNAEIEAGGKKIYTRAQINELVQKYINPNKKIKNMPSWIVKCGLPALKLLNRNMYDKFAFFMEVISHDLIAPQVGETSLEKYLEEKLYQK